VSNIHTAEILSVGTELLLGNIVNTDARDISEKLSELGINVFYHTVVGDNPERLTQALETAKQRADIIITTGGLGPTCDDLTKQVLAKSFGLELYFDEEEAESIRHFFHTCHAGRPIPENNMQQAYLPVGCTKFHNLWGTAPGCAFEADGVHVLMLPGPPRECNAMLNHCAIPYLRKLSDEEIFSHTIHIFGAGESAVEEQLHRQMTELANPTLAPYAKEGEVMLRATAKAKSHAEAEAMLQPLLAEVETALGDLIYAYDVASFEASIVGLLKEKQCTLSAAESCTGGLLAQRMTSIPGASAVFRGGVTVYSNESKSRLLGIDPTLIAEHGAVSELVAREMATHMRETLETDLSVGITGLAGPDGDGSNTSVGTVFVSLASATDCFVRELHLGTGRTRLRTAAVNHAFDMVRRYLTGKPVLAEYQV
jgi:nicotinamide-nucleotide amidase